MRSVVVLPQPDGPISAMNSPSASPSRRSIPRTASCSPKRFEQTGAAGLTKDLQWRHR